MLRHRTGRLVPVLALALALAAAPAMAELYTVTLTNGASFVSRYQPQRASWDAATVLLLTDVGNWMAVEEAEIESIAAESETKGFGLRIDSVTLVFGWAPNDAPEEGEAPAEAPSALDQFLNRSYDMQQFVEPGEAGGGGVPVYGLPYSSGGGGGGFFGGGGTAPAPAPAPPSGSGGSPQQ